MARRRSGFITVDVSELLNEVDDADLLAEVEDRGLEAGLPDGSEIVREAHEELRRGRMAEALALLDRVLTPKWRSRDGCLVAYDLFRKATHQ